MVHRQLTKKEKELITLITDYSKYYSKEKTELFTIIKFDEIAKESNKDLLDKLYKGLPPREQEEIISSKDLYKKLDSLK